MTCIDYRRLHDCGCWFCFSADGTLVRIERCDRHQHPQLPRVIESREE